MKRMTHPAVAICTLALVTAAFIPSLAWGEMIPVAGAAGPEGISLASQGAQGVEINYEMHAFGMEAVQLGGRDYQHISLPGVLLPNDAGAPDLPGLSRMVAIPQGAEVTFEIVSASTRTYENVSVSPAPVIPREDDDSPLVYEEDPAIYQRNAAYPAGPVTISAPTQVRGVDAVMVGVTPFQYNPVTRELVVYTELDVRIDFVGGNGRFGEKRLRSRYWEPILRDHLLNYETLPAVDFNTVPDGNREGYEYIIITPTDPGFVQWAETLKEWRQLQGISTEVFTTNETGTTWTAIEAFLNNAYNTWDPAPAAFMILGDYPSSGDGGRDIAITSPVWDGYCVSDNIYADVNGDDLPDMAHGRICARDAAELGHMITKMLDYEQNPYTDEGFYDHPVIAGGWQTERWFILCTETIWGHQNVVLGKNPVREYAIYSGYPGSQWSSNQNTPIVVEYFGPNGLGYIPATPQHLTDWGANATRVNNDLNAGAYMLLHRDHGSVTGWGEPDYDINDLNGLTNEMYPFVFTINCLTGKYNHYGECFTERFHRMNYGALGLVAASETSYSFVNDTFIWGMFDGLWHGFMPDYGPYPVDDEFRYPAFGMASGKHFLYSSSWPYNPQSKDVTYHLFHHHGDAFLTMYTEVPQTLSVIHDGICFIGLDFFTIQADEGALIALTVDGEIIGVATATGTAQDVPIIPQQEPGNLRITVTKPDYFRHDETVPIIPPAGPYVTLGQKIIDDDMSGESAGNADGDLDAGEAAELVVHLKNVGTETATNVRATLTCADAFVTVVDDYEEYGDILAGGEDPPADDFDIYVSPQCPDGHVVVFEVLIESDNRMTWEKQFSLPVEAPTIELSMWLIDDGVGGNGVVDPGETITVTTTVANNGSEDATGLDIEFRVSYGYITVTQGHATLASLPAGGSTVLTPPFEFTVDPSIPTPNMLPAHLLIAGDWSITADLEFEMPVGGLSNNVEGGAQDWTHYAMPGWQDRWHLETHRNHTPGGTTSWKFGGNGSYPYSNSSYGMLETGPFELPAGSVLSFWHWRQIQETYDGGLLQVTTDGGATWETVTPVGGYPHTITQQGPVGPGPFPNGTGVWSGTADWQQVTVDLGPHTAPDARLRWVFGSDGSTIYEGWYIDDVFIECGMPTSGAGTGEPAIVRPLLMPARPNPVVLVSAGGRGPVLQFALPEAAPAELTVLDAQGRLVRRLVTGRIDAGPHLISWDGRDQLGAPVPAGTYYVRLATGDTREVRTVTVVR